MNSQIIAQSSRDRLLINSQPRRAGLTRNHKGPSLLTQISGPPKSSTNIMASRGSTKQPPKRNKLIVKEEKAEDVNRPPDTDSSDTEDNVTLANIKTTTFTRRCENKPDKPLPKANWEERRAASRAADQDKLDKIRAKAARRENAAEVTANKPTKGSCTTPASSQSSSSSKRKSQDEELKSPRYGKDLVDEHGRLKSKKPKKTMTFSKNKPFKREPGFVRPDSGKSTLKLSLA